jgi:hypothetical protein
VPHAATGVRASQRFVAYSMSSGRYDQPERLAGLEVYDQFVLIGACTDISLAYHP